MYAVSPLRYPGAKWRLERFVTSLLAANGLEHGHYVEPFAGGASLAISLLLRGSVEKIHLNDLDRSIFAFWYSVLFRTEELIDKIAGVPVSMDSWYEQKEVQRKKASAGMLELGFSTFFLNRTNRSGILSAGVIGGKAQEGRWKIDARFNKGNLISRVRRLADLRERIEISNLDALDFLKKTMDIVPGNSLVYLDPPYFVKGQDLYMNYYGCEDHARLASYVQEHLKLPWMVSYDDTPEIKSLYSRAKSTEEPYSLPYSASKERKGREVFFLAPGLKTEVRIIHETTRTKRAIKKEMLANNI